jgi:hypothetical protein
MHNCVATFHDYTALLNIYIVKCRMLNDVVPKLSVPQNIYSSIGCVVLYKIPLQVLSTKSANQFLYT